MVTAVMKEMTKQMTKQRIKENTDMKEEDGLPSKGEESSRLWCGGVGVLSVARVTRPINTKNQEDTTATVMTSYQTHRFKILRTPHNSHQ